MEAASTGKLGDTESLLVIAQAVELSGTDDTRARRLYESGLDTCRRLGDVWGPGLALVGLGRLALRRADHPAAADLAEAALAHYRSLQEDVVVERVDDPGDQLGGEVAGQLAECLRDQVAAQDRFEHLARAGSVAVLETLLAALEEIGEFDRAQQLVDAVLALPDLPTAQATALHSRLGWMAYHGGRTADAESRIAAARMLLGPDAAAAQLAAWPRSTGYRCGASGRRSGSPPTA